MRTAITFERPCGARVKIEHNLKVSFDNIWNDIQISVALKGKRKFVSIPSEYIMQKYPYLYISDDQEDVIKNNLHQVTDDEIRQVKEKALNEIRKQIM